MINLWCCKRPKICRQHFVTSRLKIALRMLITRDVTTLFVEQSVAVTNRVGHVSFSTCGCPCRASVFGWNDGKKNRFTNWQKLQKGPSMPRPDRSKRSDYLSNISYPCVSELPFHIPCEFDSPAFFSGSKTLMFFPHSEFTNIPHHIPSVGFYIVTPLVFSNAFIHTLYRSCHEQDQSTPSGIPTTEPSNFQYDWERGFPGITRGKGWDACSQTPRVPITVWPYFVFLRPETENCQFWMLNFESSSRTNLSINNINIFS